MSDNRASMQKDLQNNSFQPEEPATSQSSVIVQGVTLMLSLGKSQRSDLTNALSNLSQIEEVENFLNNAPEILKNNHHLYQSSLDSLSEKLNISPEILNILLEEIAKTKQRDNPNITSPDLQTKKGHLPKYTEPVSENEQQENNPDKNRTNIYLPEKLCLLPINRSKPELNILEKYLEFYNIKNLVMLEEELKYQYQQLLKEGWTLLEIQKSMRMFSGSSINIAQIVNANPERLGNSSARDHFYRTALNIRYLQQKDGKLIKDFSERELEILHSRHGTGTLSEVEFSNIKIKNTLDLINFLQLMGYFNLAKQIKSVHRPSMERLIQKGEFSPQILNSPEMLEIASQLGDIISRIADLYFLASTEDLLSEVFSGHKEGPHESLNSKLYRLGYRGEPIIPSTNKPMNALRMYTQVIPFIENLLNGLKENPEKEIIPIHARFKTEKTDDEDEKAIFETVTATESDYKALEKIIYQSEQWFRSAWAVRAAHYALLHSEIQEYLELTEDDLQHIKSHYETTQIPNTTA